MGTPPLNELYGDIGELRVGPRRAVTFRRWSFVFGNETLGKVIMHGTGQVELTDRFMSTQGPLDMWLWMGKSWWVWRGVQVKGDILPRNTVEIWAEGNPITSYQN